jgi:hypothetical protein
LVVCVLGCTAAVRAAAAEGPVQVAVTVDASQVLRTFSPQRLGGTNIAAWTSAELFANPHFRKLMAELRAAQIRLPGGSWSNVLYWNGNGVRGPDGKVDPSRVGADGYPAVDYSGYAPSFMVDSKTLHPESSGWHGNIDVKGLHEFIAAVGSTPLPCPNLGTGRPVDAAEWVRYANTKWGYDARYWELGNELGGSWEAGTDLPFGKGRLTGEMYGQRYREMVAAMKAVDATIKVGGGAFPADMLREAGDLTDFVMSHIYPGNPAYSDEQQFTRVKAVAESAEELRGLISKHAPQRAGRIELGITEWGLPDYPGVRDSINALWSSLFLSEAAVAGFDFATQWLGTDMFQYASKPDGKEPDFGGPIQPMSQYWAMWMWNRYVGNRLLRSEQSPAPAVQSFATLGEDGVVVQIVNTDHDRPAEVKVELRGFEAADAGEVAVFSTREYSWDRVTGKVRWSRMPTVTPIAASPSMSLAVPPFSVVYVRIPPTGGTSDVWAKWSEPASIAQGAGRLAISLPRELYVGDKVEGWLVASSADGNSPAATADAALAVEGASLDRTTVRMAESAGRFYFVSDKPGQARVTATSGGMEAVCDVVVKAAVPQPRVYWFFQEPALTSEMGYVTDWKVTTDDSVRANQRIARIDLDGTRPSEQRRTLLRMQRMPEAAVLDRSNVRGVAFDMCVSPDFACEDPNAVVQVVMQSPANWWMVIGQVKLATARQWQTYRLVTDDPKHLEAMPFVHNLSFLIVAEKPASGSVYLDRAGLMVR